jgi:hypothetical protein
MLIVYIINKGSRMELLYPLNLELKKCYFKKIFRGPNYLTFALFSALAFLFKEISK